MSWTAIEPQVKTVARVRARIATLKDGRAKISLVFSETMMKEMCAPAAARAEAGSGENAGRIRLSFAGGHPFKFHAFGRGGYRLEFPLPDGLDKTASASEPATVVQREKGFLVIALPLEAWAAQHKIVTKPAASAARVGGGIATPKKIDPVSYLLAKGAKIVRHGNGYMIGGQKVSAMTVVSEINRHRRLAELEPIGVDDIE